MATKGTEMIYVMPIMRTLASSP